MEWIGTDARGKINNEAISRDLIHYVSTKNQNQFQIIPYIATDSQYVCNVKNPGISKLA